MIKLPQKQIEENLQEKEKMDELIARQAKQFKEQTEKVLTLLEKTTKQLYNMVELLIYEYNLFFILFSTTIINKKKDHQDRQKKKKNQQNLFNNCQKLVNKEQHFINFILKLLEVLINFHNYLLTLQESILIEHFQVKLQYLIQERQVKLLREKNLRIKQRINLNNLFKKLIELKHLLINHTKIIKSSYKFNKELLKI